MIKLIIAENEIFNYYLHETSSKGLMLVLLTKASKISLYK
tara:strand:- start:257 stop:376 length:120 start_codon:yes stop_codon:yes gene_type:complete